MERFTSIFDDEGIIVFDKWAAYKRKRDRNDDEEDEEGVQSLWETKYKIQIFIFC